MKSAEYNNLFQKTQIKNLKTSVEEKASKISELISDNKVQQEDLNKSELKFNDLSWDVQEEKNQKLQNSKDFDSLSKRYSELEKQNEGLGHKVEGFNSQIQDITARNEELQLTLERQKLSNQSELTESETKFSDLQKKYEELQKDQENLKKSFHQNKHNISLPNNSQPNSSNKESSVEHNAENFAQLNFDTKEYNSSNLKPEAHKKDQLNPDNFNLINIENNAHKNSTCSKAFLEEGIQSPENFQILDVQEKKPSLNKSYREDSVNAMQSPDNYHLLNFEDKKYFNFKEKETPNENQINGDSFKLQDQEFKMAKSQKSMNKSESKKSICKNDSEGNKSCSSKSEQKLDTNNGIPMDNIDTYIEENFRVELKKDGLEINIKNNEQECFEYDINTEKEQYKLEIKHQASSESTLKITKEDMTNMRNSNLNTEKEENNDLGTSNSSQVNFRF